MRPDCISPSRAGHRAQVAALEILDLTEPEPESEQEPEPEIDITSEPAAALEPEVQVLDLMQESEPAIHLQESSHEVFRGYQDPVANRQDSVTNRPEQPRYAEREECSLLTACCKGARCLPTRTQLMVGGIWHPTLSDAMMLDAADTSAMCALSDASDIVASSWQASQRMLCQDLSAAPLSASAQDRAHTAGLHVGVFRGPSEGHSFVHMSRPA